jgi:hypothetical protein
MNLGKNPPAHNVFPVGSMNDDFPDVMTAGRSSPRRIFNAQTVNRTAQVCAMPGSLIKCLVD